MHKSTHGIIGHTNFCLHALVLRTLPHFLGGGGASPNPPEGGGVLCTHTMHHLGYRSLNMHVKVLLFKGLEWYINLHMHSLLVYPYRHHLLLHNPVRSICTQD